ncbi:MAG: hypothetical protein ACC662_03285 [Planctomycetota bacterium]
MGTAVLVLVVALYAAVATAYLEARRRREAPPAWARLVGPVAVAAHLLGLIALGQQIQRSPFATTSQALSFLAFSLVALYLVLEATSRVATHGGGFYAAAALLAAVSVPGLIEQGPAALHVSHDSLRAFHIGLALMGTAAVFAGGLLAGGYLGQYRRVKHGTLKGGAEGPSLRGFERLVRRASFLGVLLLLPALVLGVLTVRQPEPPPGAALLTLAMAICFVLVAVAGWLWWRRPLHGRFAAWMNLAALVVIVLTFLLVHPLVIAGRG